MIPARSFLISTRARVENHEPQTKNCKNIIVEIRKYTDRSCVQVMGLFMKHITPHRNHKFHRNTESLARHPAFIFPLPLFKSSIQMSG